ncbi:unnamed protein product [Knipowitschia caucasica]|uniref:Secretory carrier-associated membrane protein n=1 Tax=Knipowitschia caucasica TaxID=637954 RepID=A0AAV2L2X5_KNICA
MSSSGNPFEDPSVTQAMSTTVTTVEDFSTETSGSTTPAVIQTTDPQDAAAAVRSDLLRRQEELERKAAELEKREEEINRTEPGVNNWPPLPALCPIKPCFYQNFTEEIPPENQRLCRMLYYLCMLNSVTLFLNVLACLALFTTAPSHGQDFGLSLVWLLLFTPCSFLCWYRPVYKAFRTDSSFSFFFFFFVFLAQTVIFVIQSVGIPGWGNSGWLMSFAVIGENKVVGGILITVAILFSLCSVLSIILLKMVHSSYRRSGATFVKAQQEFSQGVMATAVPPS